MEIKFRAWLKGEKKMVEVRTIDFIQRQIGFNDKQFPDFSFIRLANFDEIEPLRFTGYTDNNGREIYEGDIICLEKWTNACAVVRYGECLGDCENNDEVFNRQLGFYVEHLHYKNDYRRFLYWVDDCEVVGNIFEREVKE